MRGRMKYPLRYAVIVALLSLFFPFKAALAQISFPTQTNYETGTIDTADGTFCPPSTAKTCFTLNNPTSIAVGNFNRDEECPLPCLSPTPVHQDMAVINGLPVKAVTEFK